MAKRLTFSMTVRSDDDEVTQDVEGDAWDETTAKEALGVHTGAELPLTEEVTAALIWLAGHRLASIYEKPPESLAPKPRKRRSSSDLAQSTPAAGHGGGEKPASLGPTVRHKRVPITCPICKGPGRNSKSQHCQTCYSGLYNDTHKVVKACAKQGNPLNLLDDREEDLKTFVGLLKLTVKPCPNGFQCTPEAFAYTVETKERCQRCRSLLMIKQLPEVAYDIIRKAVTNKLQDIAKQDKAAEEGPVMGLRSSRRKAAEVQKQQQLQQQQQKQSDEEEHQPLKKRSAVSAGSTSPALAGLVAAASAANQQLVDTQTQEQQQQRLEALAQVHAQAHAQAQAAQVVAQQAMQQMVMPRLMMMGGMFPGVQAMPTPLMYYPTVHTTTASSRDGSVDDSAFKNETPSPNG